MTMSRIHWAQAVNGAFTDAQDWSGGVVPGAADDAILDASGAAFTVTSTGTVTVDSIQTSANATLSLYSSTMDYPAVLTATTGTGDGANAGIILLTNSILETQGTLDNTGTIELSGKYGTSSIYSTGDFALTGGGLITMSDAFGGISGNVVENVNNTITGSGQLGASSWINEKAGVLNITNNTEVRGLVNDGLVDTTGESTIYCYGTVTNNGTIVLRTGGDFDLALSTLEESAGATFTTGGTVTLELGTITGSGFTLSAAGSLDVIKNISFSGSGVMTGTFVNEGTVAIANDAGLTLQNTVDNVGAISLASTGALTELVIGAAGTTLGGGGTLTMSDSARNEVVGLGAGSVLNNQADTISGAGALGAGKLTLINGAAGVIEATGINNALVIDTGPNTIANAGAIWAEGSAGLVIDGATIDNTGAGIIFASAGSHVTLENAKIVGGAVGSGGGTGGGAIEVTTGDTTFDGASTPVSVSGLVGVYGGATLTLLGRVTNSGSIDLEGVPVGGATLEIGAGATTLNGGGSITLDSSGGGEIIGANASSRLVDLDNTISGAGTITGLTLVNGSSGVIDANSNNALTLDSGASTISNTGLIEATGFGGLKIDGTVNNTGGGVISVASGTAIDLDGVTVIGGTLRSTGTGRIFVLDATGVFNGATSTLDNEATIEIPNGASLTIVGSIANSGTIELDADKTLTSLIVGTGGATLSGGGRLMLSANANNRVVGATSSATLTNVDDRISGAGELGGGSLVLVNEAKGLILGNLAAGLTIDTGASTVTNAGLIEVQLGGVLTIDSALANSGHLEAFKGVLTVNGAVSGTGSATIAGGTLDFTSTFDQNIFFKAGTTGELILGQSQTFTRTVFGFSTSGASSLDLLDIGFVGSGEAVFSGTTRGGVLTVSDGTHTAHIHLHGDYEGTTFTARSDGQGGTLIVDQAADGAAAVQRFVSAAANLGATGSTSSTLSNGGTSGSAPTLAKPAVG
jgi:hypothetical protein